ncbi:MAG: isoprenoid biosynthesis glyoxalase ElbB [Planctomycetota bacterium]|nr:isoprenoid biosynthesis glyoxalase ElbB [Planctomycetota bacterium]
MSKKVAVVLAGCGRGDGSEIHESVSALIHLSRHRAQYSCFAPDIAQSDVVNHVTGEPSKGETRNCMVEAARISRGQIAPLATLDVDAFDAVIFPGGFGAAKNLSTFARDGAECSVLPDVARVIKGFHASRKPIGLICIAPVLGAKVLGLASGGPGCTITLGADEGANAQASKMGAKAVNRWSTESYTDEAHKVVTTPAYMCDAKPFEVYEGIGRLVDSVIALCK